MREASTSPRPSPTEPRPSTSTHKSPTLQRNHTKKKRRKREFAPEPGSSEDVLWRDVVELLGGADVVKTAKEEGWDWQEPLETGQMVKLDVLRLSSTGSSLSLAPTPAHDQPNQRLWAVITPFALPGETILARVARHSRLHSHADLVEVLAPNKEMRDDERVRCRYFGVCAGCQYQMLSYETQLQLKRDVVVKAYKNFSDLAPSFIPPIGPTIPSPLQYHYRTKITPHFDLPSLSSKKRKAGAVVGEDGKPEWLKIGFNKLGFGREVLDIEECPIATKVINEALPSVRQNIIENIHTYKRGATLLLRDSLAPPPPSDDNSNTDLREEKHVCITDPKATVHERVGPNMFEYPAGSFFQNNNSVLVPLTTYVRDALFSSPTNEKPTHLVDAYCGSGLFSVTLARDFERVIGIEISADSIRSASANARLNALPASLCSFQTGDASNIFSTPALSEFPREKTVVIVDPPRKGCDAAFLERVVEWRCRWVVYVSCNVHTQARDVGVLVSRTGEGGKGRYVVQSVRGVDLFPQTAHVESVAVLKLVKDE